MNIIIQCKFFEWIFRTNTLNESHFMQKKILNKNLLDEKSELYYIQAIYLYINGILCVPAQIVVWLSLVIFLQKPMASPQMTLNMQFPRTWVSLASWPTPSSSCPEERSMASPWMILNMQYMYLQASLLQPQVLQWIQRYSHVTSNQYYIHH